MRFLPPVLLSLCIAAPAAAQNCPPLGPSGQPALAGIAPVGLFTVPLAVVEVAGNANFQIRSAVVTPIVPAGRPMFLVLGFPAAPIAVGAPPLDPAYGLPGLLPMSAFWSIDYVGVTGTLGNPPHALPIPPGLGPLGLVLMGQIAVLGPAGSFGLTGAMGIVI